MEEANKMSDQQNFDVSLSSDCQIIADLVHTVDLTLDDSIKEKTTVGQSTPEVEPKNINKDLNDYSMIVKLKTYTEKVESSKSESVNSQKEGQNNSIDFATSNSLPLATPIAQSNSEVGQINVNEEVSKETESLKELQLESAQNDSTLSLRTIADQDKTDDNTMDDSAVNETLAEQSNIKVNPENIFQNIKDAPMEECNTNESSNQQTESTHSELKVDQSNNVAIKTETKDTTTQNKADHSTNYLKKMCPVCSKFHRSEECWHAEGPQKRAGDLLTESPDAKKPRTFSKLPDDIVGLIAKRTHSPPDLDEMTKLKMIKTCQILYLNPIPKSWTHKEMKEFVTDNVKSISEAEKVCFFFFVRDAKFNTTGECLIKFRNPDYCQKAWFDMIGVKINNVPVTVDIDLGHCIMKQMRKDSKARGKLLNTPTEEPEKNVYEFVKQKHAEMLQQRVQEKDNAASKSIAKSPASAATSNSANNIVVNSNSANNSVASSNSATNSTATTRSGANNSVATCKSATNSTATTSSGANNSVASSKSATSSTATTRSGANNSVASCKNATNSTATTSSGANNSVASSKSATNSTATTSSGANNSVASSKSATNSTATTSSGANNSVASSKSATNGTATTSSGANNSVASSKSAINSTATTSGGANNSVAKVKNNLPIKTDGATTQNTGNCVKMKPAYMPPEKFSNTTYGLNEVFLQSLGLKLPLCNVIIVIGLADDLDDDKIKEVFSLAGTVNKAFRLMKKDGTPTLKGIVEYDHPVEAVQAVSMFHAKPLNGRQLIIKMAQKVFPRPLPMGLTEVGPGLGPEGEPIKGVRAQIELQTLKKMFNDFKNMFEQKISDIDKAIAFQNTKIDAFTCFPEPAPPKKAPTPAPQTPAQPTDAASQLVNALNSLAQPNVLMGLNTLLSAQGFAQQGIGADQASASAMQSQLMMQNAVYAQNVNMQGMTQQPVPGIYAQPGPAQPGLVQPQLMQPMNQTQMVPTPQPYYNQTQMVQPAFAPMQTVPAPAAVAPAPQVNPSQPPTSYPKTQPASSYSQTENQQQPEYTPKVVQIEGPTNSRWDKPPVTAHVAQKHKASEPKPTYVGEPSHYKRKGGFDVKEKPNSNLKAVPVTDPEPKKKSDMLVFSNLPSSVTVQALNTKMQEVGELAFGEMTGRGRALVRFKHARDAERCIKLFDRSKVDGQVINVEYF